MDNKNLTSERLAWRLAELAKALGLSVPFLRTEIKRGNLKAQRRGATVLVTAEEAKRYLNGEPEPSANREAFAS